MEVNQLFRKFGKAAPPRVMNWLKVPLLLDAIVVMSYMSNSRLDQWMVTGKEYFKIQINVSCNATDFFFGRPNIDHI